MNDGTNSGELLKESTVGRRIGRWAKRAFNGLAIEINPQHPKYEISLGIADIHSDDDSIIPIPTVCQPLPQQCPTVQSFNEFLLSWVVAFLEM
jgi:hypothetical protein